MSTHTHHEAHKIHRSGWLRAAVMGANDGIVSTASLIIGVASAGSSLSFILLAGVAGLVAGAMSMAAGEYVSVSTQADIETADLALEKQSLIDNPKAELAELTEIYRERGLESGLAGEVAKQLMDHDALGAHARDEIGISDNTRARPITAALSSACTFAIGAALPLCAAWVFTDQLRITGVAVLALVFLLLLGCVSAYAGGAPILRSAIRVTFWGALAMALTYAVGLMFGVGV